MTDTDKKYPNAVKAIYITGKGGAAGHEIEIDSTGSTHRPKVSKMYRGWDRESRAMSLAAAEFFKSYLKHHDASNEQTKDGALKHFSKNALKAHKAAFEVLKEHSKVVAFDPSESYDNMVEYLEELEEETEDEKD